MLTVITFGTFDLFHIGHLNILERAKKYGDRLVVGISSDELNISKKNKAPVYSFENRKDIIKGLRCVNSVFKEESLEDKKKYIIENNANLLIMGDDWEGKFDHLLEICNVIYLPRTPSISTTETVEKIIFLNTK